MSSSQLGETPCGGPRSLTSPLSLVSTLRYKITAPLDYGGDLEVLMCKRCGRFRTKHSGKGSKETWAECELESAELMALCLRTAETRISKAGLELDDAGWVWTEPHSRRLKVRCVVKKHMSELPNGGVTLQAAKVSQSRLASGPTMLRMTSKQFRTPPYSPDDLSCSLPTFERL